MDNKRSRDLLRRVESGIGLPALSPVALHLVNLATDDRATVDDLASLIEKDPSLTLRLLKLANSAAFRRGRPVGTLSQAAVRLGFDRVRILALSLSLRETFPLGQVGPLDYGLFWRASLYRGLIARRLAPHFKGLEAEEAFIAGLILEIGLLVLFELCLGKDPGVSSIALEPLEALLEWETERCGLNHREVGEALLRSWHFPERIVQCQRLHGMEAYAAGADSLAAVCELSKNLARILYDQVAFFHDPFVEAARLAGLDQSTLTTVLLDVFDLVEDLAESLRVSVSPEEDLMALMEKANRTLDGIAERMSAAAEPSRHEPGRAAKTPRPSLEHVNWREDQIAFAMQAVVHEIRNPLTAVGGFARRLVASLEPDAPDARYARLILQEAERLERVLASLTLFGKDD